MRQSPMLSAPPKQEKVQPPRAAISYGIVMTVTENGFNETTSFPDISFSRKKLRDFVSMLERNDVSPAHVEEMIDDFFYAG